MANPNRHSQQVRMSTSLRKRESLAVLILHLAIIGAFERSGKTDAHFFEEMSGHASYFCKPYSPTSGELWLVFQNFDAFGLWVVYAVCFQEVSSFDF